MRTKNRLFRFGWFICCLICLTTLNVQAQDTDVACTGVFQEAYVDANGMIQLKLGAPNDVADALSKKVDLYVSDTYEDNTDVYADESESYAYLHINNSNTSIDKKMGMELQRIADGETDYRTVSTFDSIAEEQLYTYQDTSAEIGKTYMYRARVYINAGDAVLYTQYSEPITIRCVPSPGKIQSVRATGKNALQIKWTPASNVDGYEIYIKEFSGEDLATMFYYSRYVTDNITPDESMYSETNTTDSMNFDESDAAYWSEYYGKYEPVPDSIEAIPYRKVATLQGAAQSSYTYHEARHGYGYFVQIRTYKNGALSSVSYCAHGINDYYYCVNAENPKYQYKWPSSQKKAKKMMKTIRVKTWTYRNQRKHKGKKITRYQYITVNKQYASTVKQIFSEIYKSKQKPPIYEAGSYRWRQSESKWSFHTVGTAIDINSNENPMYTRTKSGKKKIAVGSFYKPKSNPYSMPRNGVIEKIFEKYGFERLDNDLMHYEAVEYSRYNSNY